MKVLVTGADGFVGRHLLASLLQHGHQVTAAYRPEIRPESWAEARWRGAVAFVPFELTDSDRISSAVTPDHDAVVHLAAVASVREARQDPGRAWIVNAAGTARLVEAVAITRSATDWDPVILMVSTAEVYGCGPARPRLETDLPAPQSTYAASKLGGEIAALECWRRTGLRVIIARPFTHTGPGQALTYVIPSFIQRLLAAKAEGSSRVATGNLEPVRDFLDVRDVVEAYIKLLSTGSPGETYNIARQEGISLGELFALVADHIGIAAEPVPDPTYVRSVDIPHLVGDAEKLRRATGWAPRIPLEQTIRDMVNAQAH